MKTSLHLLFQVLFYRQKLAKPTCIYLSIPNFNSSLTAVEDRAWLRNYISYKIGWNHTCMPKSWWSIFSTRGPNSCLLLDYHSKFYQHYWNALIQDFVLGILCWKPFISLMVQCHLSQLLTWSGRQEILLQCGLIIADQFSVKYSEKGTQWLMH